MAISVSFPFSWVAQPRAWGPASLGAGFLYRILSLTGLFSKVTDFLSSPSYITVQRPLLLVGVTISLIQPIHGQGYNSVIPRPDAPVFYLGAFPILTARPGRRSIYIKIRLKIVNVTHSAGVEGLINSHFNNCEEMEASVKEFFDSKNKNWDYFEYQSAFNV